MTEFLHYLGSLRLDGYMTLNLFVILGMLYIFHEKVDWTMFNRQLESYLSYKKDKIVLEEKFNNLLKTKYDEIEAYLTKKYQGLKKDEDDLVVSIRDKQGQLDRIKAEIVPLEEKKDTLKKEQAEIVRTETAKLNIQREELAQKAAELSKKELVLNGKEQELKVLDGKIAENEVLVTRLDGLCTYISGATNLKVEDLIAMLKRTAKQAH